MQTKDIEEFNKLLDSLGSIFTKPIDDVLRRTYWDALKAHPLKTIRELVTSHIASEKFFPKPSEIAPKKAPREDSRHPDLFSSAWWEKRTQLLRSMFPNGLNSKSRKALDTATFGLAPTPQQEHQASICYDQAWPQLSRSGFPEADF